MSLYITDESGKLHKIAGAGKTPNMNDYYKKTETYSKSEVDEKIDNIETGESVDLTNYYTKDQTYSQKEVDDLISGIETGGTGGSSSILLWENANPLSSFSESYIQLNDTLLNYDFFEIGYRLSNGTNLGEKFYKYSFVESYDGTPTDMYYTIQDNVPNTLVRRVFGVLIGGSSIRFQNAEYGSSTDNTRIIPTHVYGYKGV